MMLLKKCVAFAAMAVLFACAGCANVPKQAYNRAANQDIKKVVILKPPVMKEYVVQNFGHPGVSFGLIGGIIAAVDMQSKTTDFTTKLKSYNFDPGGEFADTLARELRAAGFEVSVIEVERPKPAMLDSYDKLDPAPDAYIDTVLNWTGYFTASPTADYVPAMRTLVRVVKSRSKEIAYQELISYGYELRGGQAVNLAADRKYNFGNFSALMTDAERALEGLRVGIPLLARQVRRDLAPDAPDPVVEPAAPPVQMLEAAAPPAAVPVAAPAPAEAAPAKAP